MQTLFTNLNSNFRQMYAANKLTFQDTTWLKHLLDFALIVKYSLERIWFLLSKHEITLQGTDPNHLTQLYQRESEAFPSRLNDVISPVSPGSSLSTTSWWEMSNTTPLEMHVDGILIRCPSHHKWLISMSRINDCSEAEDHGLRLGGASSHPG